MRIVRTSVLFVALGLLCSGCWVRAGGGHDGRDWHEDHRGDHGGEHREDRR